MSETVIRVEMGAIQLPRKVTPTKTIPRNTGSTLGDFEDIKFSLINKKQKASG